jgi:hypothetical protein
VTGPACQNAAGRAAAAAQVLFDPPAFLPDFDDVQRTAWDALMRSFFQASATRLSDEVKAGGGDPDKFVLQFFDPTTDSRAPVIQAITWNAFPKELLSRFGRKQALVEADRLWPLAAYGQAFFKRWYEPETPGAYGKGGTVAQTTFFRPQVEYCEWRVARDPVTGCITQVTFTSEPPEYWIAMFGGAFPGGGPVFPDGRKKLLGLYRDLVSPDVVLEDLIATRDDPNSGTAKGGYDPYNKWNTTHGIAHLSAPPNSLGAEVLLGGDATLRRVDGSGKPVTDPSALICCSGYGGPGRNSDPTIGAAVNALARLGAMITLPNPVGLYMDHIDTAGWETPDGSDPSRWIKIIRGSPGMIERLVVQAPGSGVDVSGLRIGGEPVFYGGQIAECITVKLVGGAIDIGRVKDNEMPRCTSRCCVASRGGTEIDIYPSSGALPPGTSPACAVPGGVYEPPRARPQIMATRRHHPVLGTTDERSV